MQAAAHLPRRRAPPDASSAPPPPAPSPSSRAAPFRPPELPLPSALVPPKKRWVLRTPPKATTPISPPPPPPVPAAAADGLAAPFPTPPPQAAADQKPSLPPPPAAEKPSLPLTPGPGKPSSPRPPPPPAAADEKPSAPLPTGAAANPAPGRMVRKIARKVVPKGTIAAPKAAAAGPTSAAAGALQSGEGHAPDKSPHDRSAAVDELVETEQNLGETAIKKPAAGCSYTAVCKTLLGKETVGGGTASCEPATNCGGAPGLEKLASRGDEADEVGMSERQRRRMMEVFVGGLNRDAKEDDVRAVLAEAGEITEVRMIMDIETKKNKGYCFVRYHDAAQARKAITEFGNVKICGKQCRVAALDRNDKIFLGNINKKWKKEDIMKLLQKIGVENIDAVTLMADCNNPGCNRGFAFLELETYRDAQIAYRKLSRKYVFGRGLNIRVAWAEPLDDPDDKQMQKVRAVFVEGVPNSWDQAKMKDIFKKYGTIELVVLSRDMRSSKRKDFAFINYTTHEAAVLCLESFDGEQLTENGSKVNIKVSLAKSVQKGKKNTEDHKCCISEKAMTIPTSERKLGPSSRHISPSSSRVVQITRDKKSSTTNGLLHVLREMAPWRHEHIGSAGSPIQDHPHTYSGEKRPFSALGNDSSYWESRNPHTQHESSTYTTSTSSYGGSPHAITGFSPAYHDTRRCLPDSDYGLTEPWGVTQMRQAGSRKPGQPHEIRH